MNKKIKTVIISLLILFFLIGIVYLFINRGDKNTLTVSQKKWIEKNKNNVIDLSIMSGVPIINESGNGIFIEFLNTLEKETGLEFNKLSYNKGSKATSDYRLEVSDKIDNGMLFYRDNYVLVTQNTVHYNDVTELKNLKIGHLKTTKVGKYFKGSTNCDFISFDDEKTLSEALKNKSVNAILLPKLDYIETILANSLNIAYNLDEYPINYVLKFGNNEKLNTILKDYFEGYKKAKYNSSYDKYLSETYFGSKQIDAKEQASFRSKRYSFGFVLDEPYMVSISGRLGGFNHSLVKSFSKAAGVDIDFKRYSSIENLLKDFNGGKIDLIYGDIDASSFDIKIYKTVNAYNNKLAIITLNSTDLTVNNFSSLSDVKVMAVKNTNVYKHLKKNKIKVKTYENTDSLIEDLSKDKVAVVDEYTYDYFIRNNIKNVIKLNTINIDEDFGFIAKNNKNNKIFNEFLNFYITFSSPSKITNESYRSIFLNIENIVHMQIILCILVIILLFLVLILVFSLFKKKGKRKLRLSKNDKLRYVDSMTSIKNRNYLNDNIAKWDSSKVYPQSIVIIDLNNIAYINDNFGHAEGDKVISEASSVLIKYQLSNSELVRTNGNEFLVLLVGHSEKDIVTYIRKLNKEFKELSHGFGAAIGYSMIKDEIKTIDDAINEATIDMRKNKENTR